MLLLCDLLVLPVLLALVTESVAAQYGLDWRAPLYSGGAAGLAMLISGLPFAGLLARAAKNPRAGSAFWLWFGILLLIRLLALIVFSFGFVTYFNRDAARPLLVMMAVFLPGLFVESGWLANRFCAGNKIGRTSNG